jgi:hypothetical protein
VAQDRLVGGLADALRERLHVVPSDPAVVREALVDHDLLARGFGEVVVVQREDAADRGRCSRSFTGGDPI